MPPIRDAVSKSDTKKAETHKASPLCWTSAGRRILHLRFPFGSVGSHFRPQRPRTVYVLMPKLNHKYFLMSIFCFCYFSLNFFSRPLLSRFVSLPELIS